MSDNHYKIQKHCVNCGYSYVSEKKRGEPIADDILYQVQCVNCGCETIKEAAYIES